MFGKVLKYGSVMKILISFYPLIVCINLYPRTCFTAIDLHIFKARKPTKKPSKEVQKPTEASPMYYAKIDLVTERECFVSITYLTNHLL